MSPAMTDRRSRVAVMSPEPVVVAGLSAILGRHPSRIELVAHSVVSAEPDVVLYDVLGLVRSDVDELARLVRRTSAVVLAIRREQRPDLLDRALAHGAAGCLEMSIGETELLALLAATAMSPRRAPSPGVVVDAGLSPRESEILVAIAQGLTNAEIADQSYLSINTVKTTIRGAYRKIGVSTRSQAVRWVLQHGLDA